MRGRPMKRRRRRRRLPPSTPLHAYGWIHTLPDEARLLVSERGKNIGTLDAADVKHDQPPILEDALLSVFGPGRYTVVPVYDGKMHKAVCAPVGDPWEHGIRRRQRDDNANRSSAEEQINSVALLVDALIEDGEVRIQKQEESQEASKQSSEEFLEVFKWAGQLRADQQKEM